MVMVLSWFAPGSVFCRGLLNIRQHLPETDPAGRHLAQNFGVGLPDAGAVDGKGDFAVGDILHGEGQLAQHDIQPGPYRRRQDGDGRVEPLSGGNGEPAACRTILLISCQVS